jgi:ATP-dependent helicase IRC3
MSNFQASGTADITVCSVQSLVRPDRLVKFNPETVKLILIDEAHHATAPTYIKILEYFGNSKTVVIGVSATIDREQFEIVYQRDYVDMIEEKWFAAIKRN